jgi:peptidoglycan/LPS O-acetylase OafA/YrhL
VSKPVYLQYINVFRGIAIIGIVAIHCRISLDWGDNDMQNTVMSALFDNSTILFIFIAGFLFQHLRSRYQFGEYLRRKARFIILPYILVSIPPILDKLIFQTESLPYSPIISIFYFLATGQHFGPFYFIPMITLYYLISPILIWIDKPWFYKFMLPPLFLIGLFTFRFGYHSNIFMSFIHFLPIYLFGMGYSHYQDRINNLGLKLWIPAIVLYLLLFSLEITGSIQVPRLNTPADKLELPLFQFNLVKLKVSILCAVFTTGLFLIRNRQFKLLSLIGDYSFGIFFLHLYFIIIAKEVIKFFPGFHLNTFSFLLYIAIVTGLSMAAVWLSRLVFGKRSRLLIGS